MHCSVRGVSSKLRAARQNATDEPALRYTRDSSTPNCSLAGYLHECTSNFTVQKAATQYSGFVAEKNTDPAATKWGWKQPISSGGSWCAGSGATGKHLTCKMSVVCHVTPRVVTSYGRRCYSPSSLSNTIVLRNEESFPGRSVLGSRRLHRSVCSELSPGNGFETRG